MKYFLSVLACCTMALTAAQAQLSVTAFGASDAGLCYDNANNDFSRDTSPCDEALSGKGLLRVDRVKTLVNRGIIFNRTGAIGAAMNDFDRAIDLDPRMAEAFVNRGNSKFLGGDLSGAIMDYETSLGYGVSKPWLAWYNIGLAHDARKEPEAALAAYKKSHDIKPDFSLARKKLEERT